MDIRSCLTPPSLIQRALWDETIRNKQENMLNRIWCFHLTILHVRRLVASQTERTYFDLTGIAAV